ncbi:MAG: S41 family peptidase [Bacteroidia bacterium]
MIKHKIVLTCVAVFLIVGLTSFNNDTKFADDFLEFWTDVKNNYAYFDKKNTDWQKVKTNYLPQAQNAKTRNELIAILENAIEELYDNHFSLNTNLQSSTRLVPSGIDIWAEYINDKAIITEVRQNSPAHKAFIKPGAEIIAINGVPVNQAVNNRIGKCIIKINDEVKNYALKQLLAGTYLVKRVLTLKQNNNTTTITLNDVKDTTQALLDFETLNNNIGYIKFNNSLGETRVVQQFDSALNNLKNTKALIIDLRSTPSGGTL